MRGKLASLRRSFRANQGHRRYLWRKRAFEAQGYETQRSRMPCSLSLSGADAGKGRWESCILPITSTPTSNVTFP